MAQRRKAISVFMSGRWMPASRTHPDAESCKGHHPVPSGSARHRRKNPPGAPAAPAAPEAGVGHGGWLGPEAATRIAENHCRTVSWWGDQALQADEAHSLTFPS